MRTRVRPPVAARKLAKRALEVRASVAPSKRGGLTTRQAGALGIGSGVARARDIVLGKMVDAQQVSSFLARIKPAVDKASARGLSWADSKALQAYYLWGGAPLKKAADAALRAAKIR